MCAGLLMTMDSKLLRVVNENVLHVAMDKGLNAMKK